MLAGEHSPQVALMVRISVFLLLLAALLLAGGQSNEESPDVAVPLRLESVGALYADYAMDAADTDDNEAITVVEWSRARRHRAEFCAGGSRPERRDSTP